jgi:selenocysteine lyase/cysteine desulfurase
MPDAEWFVARLEAEHVYVAARWGAIRVSPYLYNTAEEVERLMALLADLVAEARTAGLGGDTKAAL